jgi:hypothetical protein
MLNVAKVCISVGAGVGMCTTAPAWATVAIVSVVVVGTVTVMKDA